MEKCWARLRQRWSRRYPIFLPTVSINTCKSRHTHTEPSNRLWAQPSLHLEYTREKVGKWTEGTAVQHPPICLSSPTYTILPTTLKKSTFSRCICIQDFTPPPLSEYTNVPVVQRPPVCTTGCLKRQKTQVFHRSTKPKIRMISLSQLLQARAVTSGFVL